MTKPINFAGVGILAVLFGIPITVVNGELDLCVSQLDDPCAALSMISGDPGDCNCIADDPGDASVTTMLCTAPRGCRQCLDINTNVCYETGQWKFFNGTLASRGDYYCFETGYHQICTYFSGSVCRIGVNGMLCNSCQKNEDSGLYTVDCANIVSGTANLKFSDPKDRPQTANSTWVGKDVFGPIANIFNGPGTPTCRVKAVEVDDICGTTDSGTRGTLDWPWKSIVDGSGLAPLLALTVAWLS